MIRLDTDTLTHFAYGNENVRRRIENVSTCIALAHDALLVTRNTQDYKGVRSLRTANWVD
ncbi:MAG: hypothetical protein KatS3mg105_1644 [Gemmatales bacterium]|nr:MAG: hypothetical protein KatS3mg105_1644 [Gemmatales bacterium]